MRVFISSVTYALVDERKALTNILSVVEPYEPSRFEDFTAQGSSPREACLAGVAACDVYVLLLGPRYGEPFPDSGMAPTEEEFTLAQRQGKTILVFVKDIDEPDEPRQAAFKAKVQDYIGGRFRASFTDPVTLNQAVLAALGGVPTAPVVLEWIPVPSPPSVRWQWQTPALVDTGFTSPTLAVYLVPITSAPLLASRLQAFPNSLARAGRKSGFFAEDDHLTTGSNSELAWARVPEKRAFGHDFTERQEHTYRGVAAYRTGQVSAFVSLPTDFVGALVSADELQRRAQDLLTAAAPHLPSTAATVAVAASLGPLDAVHEGDPAKVGGRTTGHPRMRRGAIAVMEAHQAVGAAALTQHGGQVTSEIAADILSWVREAPR